LKDLQTAKIQILVKRYEIKDKSLKNGLLEKYFSLFLQNKLKLKWNIALS